MRTSGPQPGKPRQHAFTDPTITNQDGDIPPWEQQHTNHHLNLDSIPNGNSIQQTDSGLDIDSLVPDSPMHQQSPTCGGPASPNLGGLQPSLRGVKVPDEDLTPQQRQHRDEQLATLRKMQNLLFPEQGAECSGPPRDVPTNEEAQKMSMGNCNLINQQNNQMRPMMGQRPGVGNMCRPMMNENMQPMMNDIMNCGPMGPGHMLNNMQQQQQQQQQMMGGLMNHGGPMGHQQMMLGGMNMNQCMGPSGMQGHKRQMMGPGGPSHGTNTVAAQIEWHKLQHEYYEERKGKPIGGEQTNQARQLPGMRTNQGSRSQGPPPPYHQTTRSASVPIATQSPNPGSPNNPTSNLSLPSPRPGSTLSSPADPNRQQQPGFKHLSTGQSPTSQDSPVQQRNLTHSNPSTPISSNLSPNASLKDLENNSTKEPNLMPVPSPQQIQYLNTFEGQELTIQKQPNTSLKDSSISPS